MAKRVIKKKHVKQVEKAIKKMSAGQIFALIFVILIIAVAGFFFYKYVIVPNLDKKGPSQIAEGDLRVHFIDVGQGDSIFIEFPNGKSMIIDGGEDGTSSKNYKLLPYLKALNIDKIEYMVLTHTDADHIEGLDNVLAEFIVEKVYMPNFTTQQITTNAYKNFLTAVENEQGVSTIYSNSESDIDEGGYLIDFFVMTEVYSDTSLSAEDKNAVSPLMFLEYAEKKLLLTGDANSKTEKFFLEQIKNSNKSQYDVDILKVGHHGSESSSTAEFLEVVKPEYSVIQVGEGNNHEHPRQDALDRLRSHNSEIYRTDTNGTIVLTMSDDGTFDFTTEKQPTNKEDNYNGADKVLKMAYIVIERRIFC